MITSTTTPPEIEKETRLKDFNELRLIEILKQMSPQHLRDVEIAVWAIVPTGSNGSVECINILSADTSERIPELLKRVRYMTFTGPHSCLRDIGVA